MSAIEQFMTGFPLLALLAIGAVMVFLLDRGAALLVEEAVTLSLRWGLSRAVIGATVVSLGTTLPEAAVSVFAALRGDATIALGNAVGSIICDTGLILGLAALISPLPIDRSIVNRQGWIQLGAGILLVVCCLPLTSPVSAFSHGGNLPRIAGWAFTGLLILYLWGTIKWFRGDNSASGTGGLHADSGDTGSIVLKLTLGIVLVVGSSQVLIPAAKEVAVRLHVPAGIIAATLVAFGTSLPELATAIKAVRKGHGELAVGNVIGADILNVLFVAGASAAVTPGGLDAPAEFFIFLFPAMLVVLIVFRIGVAASRDTLGRPFGIVLVGVYVTITLLSLSLGLTAH
jgi:cation:H+ antiporter